jgi:membrane associated rhomboid family serine protease
MLLFVPIGRGKVPWITVALIAATSTVFFLTWPREKKFILAHVPGQPLHSAARDLANQLVDPSSRLPPATVDRLKKEMNGFLFPTPAVETVFSAINSRSTDDRPYDRILLWRHTFDAYNNLKKSLLKKGVPLESVCDTWEFKPRRRLWPGAVTHMFIHYGFWHLFGNMLFLWIVGCGIEERWGPFLFLSMYALGGLAAAGVASYFVHDPSVGLAGASGAVAAVMGAFLIRHYAMPINVFYAVLFKTGTTSFPAWALLPAWFAEQALFLYFKTAGGAEGGAAFGTHWGGFLFGAFAGMAVQGSDLAEKWEEEALRTREGKYQEVDRATKALNRGDRLEARRIFQDTLTRDPRHLAALHGLFELEMALRDTNAALHWLVKALTVHSDMGENDQVAYLFHQHFGLIRKGTFSDENLIHLGQCLDKAHLWGDALTMYGTIVQSRPESPYRGKALFEAGRLLKIHLRQPDRAAACFEALRRPPFDMVWKDQAEVELADLRSNALGRGHPPPRQ